MPSSLRTQSLDRALSTPRPPPPGLQFDRKQSCYRYDSSLRNRRTGQAVIGTGIPCGALTKEEQDDTGSFLEMIRAHSPQLANYLRVHHTSSRIFANRIAGLECTNDNSRPAILHLVQGRRVQLLDYTGNEAPADLHEIAAAIHHEVLTGTFHRISHYADNSRFFRLGRCRPNKECQRIAQDLVQRLQPRRLTVLRVTGIGKTTMLREMINILQSYSHIGVLSATGELSDSRVVDLRANAVNLPLLKSLDVIVIDTDHVEAKMWRWIQGARLPCIIAMDQVSTLPRSIRHVVASLHITQSGTSRYSLSHPRCKKQRHTAKQSG